MPKKLEKNSDEFYKGQIRELKAEVKKLTQRLRYYEKKAHHFEKEEYPELEEPIVYEEPCPSCSKGKLKEMMVVGRYWFECDMCDHRTKAIKI